VIESFTSITASSPSTNNPLKNVLGQPDNNCLNLGVGGYILVKLSQKIYDGFGHDLTIYACNSSTGGILDTYDVWATNNFNNPSDWEYIGEGSGSTDFDISAAGVSSATYIGILDTSDEEKSAVGSGIDAIEGLNESLY
jgi:hypothetical protein